MIVIDTHVLIWLSEGSTNLGFKTRALLDEAIKNNLLYVSAISFWEIGMLFSKNRIELNLSLLEYKKSLFRSGLKELPLNSDIAIQAAELEGFHGDPADRIITATMLHTGALLCTADKGILSWCSNSNTQDARK